MTTSYSIEAEQNLLGGLLLDNSALERVEETKLQVEDFYRDDHRRIYRHIVALIKSSQPADVVTVWDSLKEGGVADQSGGMTYLVEIANNTTSAANIHRYAIIIRDRAMRRRLADVGAEMHALASSPGPRPTSEIVDLVQNVIRDASSLAEPGGLDHVREALTEFLDVLDKRMNGEISALPTGYPEVDSHFGGGMGDGDLIVLAGRPSMGKTTLGVNIAQNLALDGEPAAVFSMEMGTSQLIDRLVSSIANVPHDQIKSGSFSEAEMERAIAAIGRLSEAPLYIDDTPALSVKTLSARAKALARKVGQLRLVVVDYIQLMDTAGLGDNRAAELGKVSGGLKALAKELSCPVIALSQLSRRCEERTDKRPVMSDLRESGALEQDADVVLMCYRDEYYNEESPDKGVAEVIARKVRNGRTGTIRLVWRGEVCRFESFKS
ncbi:MAG: replicative DNA helicase [Rhodocyclaceae bacterium]|nr:replicative DNA helicase [Rhodocyclaceae bacterium]